MSRDLSSRRVAALLFSIDQGNETQRWFLTSLAPPTRDVRHVERAAGFSLRSLAAPVVTSRGLDAGVSGHFLDSHEVHTAVEQVAYERPPTVVRAEPRNAR